MRKALLPPFPYTKLELEHAASRGAHLRRFRVECECDGAPFVWEGQAVNEPAAIRSAAYDLAVRCPMVEAEDVRATSCVEVAA